MSASQLPDRVLYLRLHHPGDACDSLGIGSQYLIAMHGGDEEFPGRHRNYRITLPSDIPEKSLEWPGREG